MKKVCLSISILILHFHLLAQSSNCVRTLRYDYLKPKLDPSICIPRGYHIINIYDNTDLNEDGLVDKVVRWQNIKLADGDTVRYSIYEGSKDGRFSLRNTLSNLKPLYFSNYTATSENGFYDSVKRKYIHPSLGTVEFEPNCIAITFYVAPALLRKLYFTYSAKKRTWILTREVQWFAPSIYKSTHKVEFDRTPASQTPIDDFNMLKFITSAKE